MFRHFAEIAKDHILYARIKGLEELYKGNASSDQALH